MIALFRSLSCAMLLICGVEAATLDVRFSPEQGSQGDPLYPGTSTISVASTGVPGVVATLAGRGYGINAAAGSERWGIVAGPLGWDATRTGWTISNGFAANKSGSTLSTVGKVEVAASYLSVLFSGVSQGTVFKNVALNFTEVSSLSPGKAWAGTSADGFVNATNLKANKKGAISQLSIDLPDFTFSGADPLEVRIYGLVGEPQGAFLGLTMAGEMVAPIMVPEPDVRVLVTAFGLGALVSFRRRGNALPRRS